MKDKRQNLAAKLKANKLDFLLIESKENRQYLTEFTGSAGTFLFPARGNPVLLVDSRYTLQAQDLTANIEVIEYQNFFTDYWSQFARKNQGKRVGFESYHLSHERLNRFRKHSRGINFVPTTYLVEDVRTVKNEVEVEYLSKAIQISDQAYTSLLRIIKPGMTEREVAWKLEVLMREGGADKLAWDPQIIAAGKNSARPHHGNGLTVLKKGDMVLLDFGCVYRGYHTDTSRMVFLGKPTAKQLEIYNLVLEAQELGISLVKPGIAAGEVDNKVKEWLKTKTTEGVYKHGLGHGVGLEIHEKPTLYTGVKDKLEVGNVITIEPGIYIAGWGGVRIEDMVLVTKTGHQVLTKATKKIEEVII